MGMVDEFERLAALHRAGSLTDEEYERAKARLLEQGRGASPLRGVPRIDRLRRSGADRWIGGVCGGIGAFTGTESWIWRLLFAAGLLLGGVTGVIYLLMWILVPSESDAD
jgi:phage shock protein PspC (stress-responsive transcriptional regulator)